MTQSMDGKEQTSNARAEILARESGVARERLEIASEMVKNLED